MGNRHGFGADLVMPRELAEDLFIARPETRAEIANILGWRDQLIGDELWRAVRGEVAISLEGWDTRTTGIRSLGE
jgi:hypothetical protein